MRRIIVTMALLAAPFLASVSQSQARPRQSEQKGHHDDKCERSNRSSNASAKARDDRSAKRDDDDDDDRDSRRDQRDERGDRGRHRGWEKKCGSAPPVPPPAEEPPPAPPPAPAPDPTPAPPPSASGLGEIHGVVFFDMNGNSSYETDEPLISDWTIELTGPVSMSVMSDFNGAYAFTALPVGNYTVCGVLKSGFAPVAPTSGPSCANGFGWSLTIPQSTPDLVLRDINFGYIMP